MTNLLSWFAGTKGELREALPAGAVAEVELPAENDRGRRAAFLRSPRTAASSRCSRRRRSQGDRRPARPLRRLERRPTRAEAGDGLEHGEGRPASPRPLVELACNLADRRESDLRPAGGVPSARPARGRRARRPADLVLPAGLGLAADLLGVVPLSAEVDRLMGDACHSVPARADPPVVAARPARPAGPGLLLLPQPGRLRPLAAGRLARARAALIVVLARAGAGRAEPAAADARAVRRLRRRPQPERRRRGAARPPTTFVARAVAAARAEPVRGPAVRRRARAIDPPGREAQATAAKPRAARDAEDARRQGDRPRRGARGGRRGDPAVLRPADRAPLRRQPHRRRRAQGRRVAARQGRGLDRAAAGPRPSPKCSSRPSTCRPRSSRASRSTSRSSIDSQPRRRQGRVEVYRGDIKVADQPSKLKKGENRFALQQTIDAGRARRRSPPGCKGYQRHAARQQQRLRPGLHRRQAARAAGRERPEQAKHLTWALEEQNMQVDVRPPQGMPETWPTCRTTSC